VLDKFYILCYHVSRIFSWSFRLAYGRRTWQIRPDAHSADAFRPLHPRSPFPVATRVVIATGWGAWHPVSSPPLGGKSAGSLPKWMRPSIRIELRRLGPKRRCGVARAAWPAPSSTQGWSRPKATPPPQTRPYAFRCVRSSYFIQI